MDLEDALIEILKADETDINRLESGPGKSEIKKIRREALKS